MGAAARQECPEGQGRALDEEERRELLRLQEPPRRGQGAQADPQMGCNRRGRARQSEARRSARSLQHRQRGMGGPRLPLGPDRGEPEGEGLAEPYPPARRSQSSAVRAPEVGEHDALEGARLCRARIRPAAELDGRQDCAHHWHRAGEVQDWHDEPRLQHPPAGSARADGSCTRLSALTGGVRVASCKGPRGRRPGVKTVPDRGLTSARALQPLAQLRQKSPKASIVRGSLYVFNCIRNSQLTLIQPMGRKPGSLAQGLSVEDRACITSAVAKVPNNPTIKIERSRVLPQSRAQGHLYKVTVEIDVSLVGQSSTYVFNCIRNG